MLANSGFMPFVIEFPKALNAQIVGFLLLIALFLWKVAPGLKTMLSDRASRVAEAQHQVDATLADVQRLRNDYAQRLQGIEAEARERIDAAVREAETARGEIIAEAQQSAIAIKRRTEEELARELTRQRILLRRQLVQTSIETAEYSLKAFADDKVQRQLIQDFITSAEKGA